MMACKISIFIYASVTKSTIQKMRHMCMRKNMSTILYHYCTKQELTRNSSNIAYMYLRSMEAMNEITHTHVSPAS